MKRIGLILAFVLLLGVLPAAASAKDELKNTDPEKYYIVLDLKNQIVTVYEKNETGEYTEADIVRRFLCSSGSTKPKSGDPNDIGSPTPVGIWKLGGRQRFGRFANFSDRARYWVQLVGDNIFHSIMFDRDDFAALKPSPYGNLGSAVSHGCIRLHVEDAKWLYYYAPPGTTCLVTDNEKMDGALKRSLKSNQLKFNAYRDLQKNFYDTEEGPNDKCWVSVDIGRMRKGNGKVWPLVASPGLGAELEIIFANPAWYFVRYEKRVGYIARGHITLTKGTRDTVENATLIRGPAAPWIFSEAGGGVKNRICKIQTDTSVTVLGTEGSWSKIRYYVPDAVDIVGYIETAKLYTGWGLVFD